MQACRLIPLSCACARSVTLVKEKRRVGGNKVEALRQLRTPEEVVEELWKKKTVMTV